MVRTNDCNFITSFLYLKIRFCTDFYIFMLRSQTDCSPHDQRGMQYDWCGTKTRSPQSVSSPLRIRKSLNVPFSYSPSQLQILPGLADVDAKRAKGEAAQITDQNKLALTQLHYHRFTDRLALACTVRPPLALNVTTACHIPRSIVCSA